MVLVDFLRKERMLRELQEEVDKLIQDESLQKDLAFRKDLFALMDQYGKSIQDVRILLDPPEASQPKSASRLKSTMPRRKRAQVLYRNPETGEEIRTRGHNHKRLKEWKEAYGTDRVAEWRVDKEQTDT